MLTKVYQRDEDYRFTDQLHQAAIYSPDRAVLHDLVHSAKLQKATIESEELEIPISKKIDPPLVIPEPIVSIEEILHIEVKTQQAENIDEDDEVASILAEKSHQIRILATEEKIIGQEEIIPFEAKNISIEEPIVIETEEFVAEEVEIPTAKISVADMEPLEREILLEALSSSMELEVGEHEEESEEEINPTYTTPISQQSTPTSSLPIEDESSNEPLSMAAYLARRAREIRFGEPSDEKIEIHTPPKEEKIVLKSQIEDSKQIIPEKDDLPWDDTGTNLSHGHKKINVDGEREHQQSLIDRFIKAEPRITPGKVAEYNLQTVARESLEEDFEFVTETMARLFAQQGKPDKARKAFKKLMEQHPEKSVYFAAQLKNLDRIKKP